MKTPITTLTHKLALACIWIFLRVRGWKRHADEFTKQKFWRKVIEEDGKTKTLTFFTSSALHHEIFFTEHKHHG